MRLCCVAACVLFSVGLIAQSPGTAAPGFSVASVIPNRSAGPAGGVRPIGTGQLTAINVTLRTLILRAYSLHDSQLRGGPAWIGSDRFDIIAKTDEPPRGGTRALLVMLQKLIADRFALTMHTETPRIPTYALVVDRSDGRLGSQVRPSTVDCAANPAPPTPNTAPVNADGWPPCGLVLMQTLAAGGRSRSQARHSAVTMQEFAVALQPVVDRPVVNRTALPGLFDIEYAFLREGATVGPDTPVRADVPDIFTALREQLGLRLESETSPVEVLVIDAATTPSAN